MIAIRLYGEHQVAARDRVKKSANGNIYEVALEEVWELFEEHLSGSHSALVCVVSSQCLNNEGRTALESSAAALGYGDNACTFITLDTQKDIPGAQAETLDEQESTPNAETDALDAGPTEPEAEKDTLDAQALFLLIEGLDPLCLIATDTQATQALNAAYRCAILPDQACRVFGRPCVTFTSFSHMLNDNQDKQIAWALLKHLPKFEAR